MTARLYLAAAGALDELLSLVGLEPVEKALNPLDPKDFLSIVDQLKQAIIGLVGPAEAAALAKALNVLDVDWAKIGGLESDAAKLVRKAAQDVLAKPAIDYPKVSARFAVSGERVVNGVKTQVNEQYGTDIAVKLSEVDKRVIDRSAKAQGFYIKDQYAKRAEALDKVAAEVIGKGVEKGAGREEIGKALKKRMGDEMVHRSDSYFMMCAAAHVNRSRAFGNLSSYDEAGFDEYEFVAIRDQVTSVQCRLLHGKRFSVKTALARYDAISDDPESVKTAMPWMQTGKDDDGNEIVYFKDAGGARQTVAIVKENAVGRKDESGSFEHKMTDAAMAEAGVAMPPCHGHCRSRIKAVTDIAIRRPGPKPVGGGSAAPAQAAPAAAPAPEKPQPAKPAAPPVAAAPKPPKKPSGGSTSGPDEPVLVKPADPKEPGFKIPPKPVVLEPTKLTDAERDAAIAKLAALPIGVTPESQGLAFKLNPGVATHGVTGIASKASAAPLESIKLSSINVSSVEVPKTQIANTLRDGTEKGALPVLYKENGQYYVFSGNHKVMAGQLAGKDAMTFRVIDGDALAAKAPAYKPPTPQVELPKPPPPPAPPKVNQTIESLPQGNIPTRPNLPPGVKMNEMEAVSKAREDAFKRALATRSEESKQAIYGFTGNDYTSIRVVESMTDEQLKKKGWPQNEIDEFRAKSALIDKAFQEKKGTMEAEVYRGIRGLTKSDVEQMLSASELTMRGTASTSWNPGVGDRYGGGGDAMRDDEYAVFYRIKQKNGLPIESISEYPGEKEILIRNGTKFRVTGASKVNDRYVIIEVEES